MAKPKSPKQPTKAAKPKKGAKPAEVQAQPPAPEPEQPQATVTAETPLEAADPPAPDAPAAESPAPAPAQSEAAMPAEAPPEPAAPARTKGKRAPKEPKPKKTSALDAAAKVLAECGGAMTTQAMIEAMAAKGYWSSPGGQTPAATLYSAILRELSTKGEQARFVKTERGKFALKAP